MAFMSLILNAFPNKSKWPKAIAVSYCGATYRRVSERFNECHRPRFNSLNYTAWGPSGRNLSKDIDQRLGILNTTAFCCSVSSEKSWKLRPRAPFNYGF